MTEKLYRQPLGLLTDLYQLTMAYGYWNHRRHRDEAVFHLHFRSFPFQDSGASYAVACGLESAAGFLEDFRFEPSDLSYLESLCGNDGSPLFEREFLDYLGSLKFSCDVDAIPEGEAVFPDEPLLRIRGPILECQLLETPLLNIVNFQTLIATKAALVSSAAGNDPVLEFGLRRAQGIDGAIAASRAAHIGGCAATSNVLAGKLFGIPVKGTHAHSWVMSFDTEEAAFEAYAEAMPNNCTLLVDTYDSIEGVARAIAIGRQLRERGHALAGIRLDSGDLAALSKEARAMLDMAGFETAEIVASNDLDERAIQELKAAGAMIGIWGVGTKLVTAYDQPALGGVYKLAAIRSEGATEWSYKLKLSNDAIKVSNPGVQQVARLRDYEGRPSSDLLFCEELTPEIARDYGDQLLLHPLFRKGARVGESEDISKARKRARKTRQDFEDREAPYEVRLEPSLQQIKNTLIAGHQLSLKT